MNKREWNEGLGHIDAELVEKYTEQNDKIKTKRKTRTAWRRFNAVAACLAIIAGAVLVYPALHGVSSPQDLTGSLFVPTHDDAIYSASEIYEMLSSIQLDSANTNAYTKLYVPDPEYLYIDTIPNKQHLTLYRYNGEQYEPNESEIRAFIDDILPKAAAALDTSVPKYEITKDNYHEDQLYFRINDINANISVRQTYSKNTISIMSPWNNDTIGKIILNGKAVEADQRLTDQEITKSLQSVKAALFDIFGVSFSDAKVVRKYDEYSEYGVEHLYVYFYDEKSHPLNSTLTSPISDNILIHFDNFQSYSGDTVSDGVLSNIDITYTQNRKAISKTFSKIANAKMISLEDAETLLHRGYVFGGHICDLCMAAQDKISFEDYDHVDIEYVFTDYHIGYNDPAMAIPFYAFYKSIGTSKNGNTIYAKTFVCAIELSGYDEFFESQKQQHRAPVGTAS